MDNSRYSFADLQQNYNNFFRPSLDIYVDNHAAARDFYVRELEVELTVEPFEVGSAYFEVTCRDNQITELNSAKLLQAFPLMSKIKIELGYDCKNKTVFEGIIFERNLEIENSMIGQLKITCLDDKSLFRLNNPFASYPSVKSISAVVQTIATKYGLDTKIDKTPEFHKPITVIQGGISDFEYIANNAVEYGYEFFVLAKVFYFRKPRSVPANMITLERRYLYELSHRTSLAGIFSKVKIQAYNQDKNQEKTAVCSSVETKVGTGKTGVQILQKNGRELVLYQSVQMNNRMPKDLSKTAPVRLEENSMNLTELTVTISGLPELIPGRFLKVAEISEGVNNTYYAKKIRHVIKNDKYRTIITAVSNTTEF